MFTLLQVKFSIRRLWSANFALVAISQIAFLINGTGHSKLTAKIILTDKQIRGHCFLRSDMLLSNHQDVHCFSACWLPQNFFLTYKGFHEDGSSCKCESVPFSGYVLHVSDPSWFPLCLHASVDAAITFYNLNEFEGPIPKPQQTTPGYAGHMALLWISKKKGSLQDCLWRAHSDHRIGTS